MVRWPSTRPLVSEAFMSDWDVVTADLPVTDKSYVVTCWKCTKNFDAGSSLWCNCDAKLRTLKCPHCASCLCAAPYPVRRRFWNDAPKSLREHASRFKIAAAPPEPSGGSAASSLRPLHVLIVDDEEPFRSLAACYVERLGYRVTTASGPDEALALTDATSFDIVLTDALMPKMDGRELCKRLKEVHGNQLKVVLMTALYTARRFQSEARNSFNVDDFLAKPLRYGDLRAALERVSHAGRG